MKVGRLFPLIAWCAVSRAALIEDGPRVVEVTPPDGSVHVSVEPEIHARFDRPVDPATLEGDFQPTTTDFTLQWSENDTVVRLALLGPLAPETTYTLSIVNVFDAAGNPLQRPARSCFSTGPTLSCPTFECGPLDATDTFVPSWSSYAYVVPFHGGSIWNRQIGASPPIHPDSAVMIERFAQTAARFGGLWLGIARDVPPVYLADERTPRRDVGLLSPNAGLPPVLTDVPIPDAALPDCGFDRFLGILDVDNGFFHELHRAQRDANGHWMAETGNAMDARAGTGIYPGDGARSAQGVRASGASLLAGLVWPHELWAGRIDHTLALGYEFIRVGGPLPPFTASDGQIDAPEAIPMGARLQLDPALDLDSLSLEPWERTIARALQEYGAFLVDSAGGISIPAVHAWSFRGNPYAELLPPTAAEERGVLLQRIPANRFRVLLPE